MSGPVRICWLNIILASVLLFLARCIAATEFENDAQNTTPEPNLNNLKNGDNYEMIDVAQRQANNNNNNLQVQTGETTRILTSGEVDDNFWLKHLGEDFKYAIHLQVGDHSYNGIYNMTEDGSNYDVKHDYRINDDPVDGNRSENPQKPETRYENPMQTEKRNVNYASNTEMANTIYRNENSTADQTQHDAYAYEEGTRLPAHKKHSSLNKRNENHKTQPNRQNKKPKKIQNINIKYAHKQQPTQQKHQTENQKQDNTHDTSHQPEKNPSSPQTAPIVVTLPNNEKTIHQLADEDTPVVVKMPPVIYHQDPTFEEYPSNEHTNQTTTDLEHTEQMISIHNQYTTHQNQQQQNQYENTDYTQYNSMPSHSPGSMHLPQHSPPMTPTQYYNPALLNEPTVYHSAAATAPNSISISSPKEQLQKSTDSVHFILRKPSKPYNGQASHNQMSLDNEF